MKIIFTNHALERLKEVRVHPNKARAWLKSARRVKRSFWREALKLVKYGDRQADVSYYWCAEHLFTVDEKHSQIRVVVTVTRRNKKGLKFAR